MKFIFPKNYNFKNKLFGFIDYSTAIFNIMCFFILFTISKLLFNSLNLKVLFLIITYFPIFLLSIIGFNNESIVYIIFYVIKYLVKPKLYLYK